MFQSRPLKDKIVIDPRHLSCEWEMRLLETVKKKKEKTLSPACGVISSVTRIIHVDPPKSINGKIIANVEFEAVSFFPSNGEIYPGTITMVLPLGLMIESDMVRILIQPANIPAGYKFDSARKVFTNGIHSYNVGEKVNFKILNVQYKQDRLNCIGGLLGVQQKEEESKSPQKVAPKENKEQDLQPRNDQEEVLDFEPENEVLEPTDTFED